MALTSPVEAHWVRSASWVSNLVSSCALGSGKVAFLAKCPSYPLNIAASCVVLLLCCCLLRCCLLLRSLLLLRLLLLLRFCCCWLLRCCCGWLLGCCPLCY